MVCCLLYAVRYSCLLYDSCRCLLCVVCRLMFMVSGLLLVDCCLWICVRCRWLVVRCSLFVVCRSLFVVGCLCEVACSVLFCSLFVVCC